jgi:hypothetical protein
MYMPLAQQLAEYPIPTRTAALVVDEVQLLLKVKAICMSLSGISIMSS